MGQCHEAELRLASKWLSLVGRYLRRCVWVWILSSQQGGMSPVGFLKSANLTVYVTVYDGLDATLAKTRWSKYRIDIDE